jgi:hypothetical protein
MDLKHRNGEDWINLAQNREKWQNVVKTVLNLRLSNNPGRLLTSYATVSFSRTTLLHAVRMTRLRDGRLAILGSFPGWGRGLVSSSSQLAVGRSVQTSAAQRQNTLAISNSVKNVWRQTSTAHTRLHYSYCRRKLLSPSLSFYTSSTLTIE